MTGWFFNKMPYLFTQPNPPCMRYIFALAVCLLWARGADSQNVIQIKDLSSFKDPSSTWKMAGSVAADLERPNVLNITNGTAILVNLPDKKNKGADLFTREEFGDMDVELDFMMAKGSNSGIYLHGRYELQLMDSWTLKSPTAGSNGGIYQRWDEKRPEGEKGYEGYPARQNASRAPGLWQHLKISFQAPRFDERGNKIQPATMLKVELNGVTIHEDVELSGPTRGAAGEEKARGPLRIQGDHGAVAFRNIKITDYGQARPASEPSRPSRVYPILVDASEIPVFRSFMDLPGGKRVVHAISVGSDAKVHYTYDTDTGMLLQVWRGGFLDATPMWFSRGDGSSRPIGAVQHFGEPALVIAKLASKQSPWKTDTLGTGFRPVGYRLDPDDNPVFLYRINDCEVSDAIQALDNGEGIRRNVKITGALNGAYFRLAEGSEIKQLQGGLYTVDANAYYLRVDEAAAKPFIRSVNGKEELLIPAMAELKYTILF